MQTIKIFDTTLRDGEQSPGATLNTKEKIQIALQLEQLGVDVIEAGFPFASPDDFKAVQTIAGLITKSTVCGLARALPQDIETCAKAIESAPKRRLHTFISTSDLHLQYQMKKTQSEVLTMTKEAVSLASKLCLEVEFSAMDATRTEIDYLLKVFEVAVQCGATTLNVPDTVGYAVPEEFGKFVGRVVDHFKKNPQIIIAVHCHNDLGLATANALSAVKNGARQIECTINGLGERAGNTALEEVVMAMRTRKDYFEFSTNINTKEIMRTSKMVSSLTGISVQRNKAIVGQNAFAHESGIHQDGILKKRDTYEIMCAEDIGLESNALILGKHSGRNALSDRLKALGYNLEPAELNLVFERFKKLADQKKEVFDQDLEAIVNDEIKISQQNYKLDKLTVTCGNQGKAVATVSLIDEHGKVSETKKEGDGPVDATYKAIDELVGNKDCQLLEFGMAAVTAGIDAQAEVTVRVKKGERIVVGRGASTDIVIASAKAYLNGLNGLG